MEDYINGSNHRSVDEIELDEQIRFVHKLSSVIDEQRTHVHSCSVNNMLGFYMRKEHIYISIIRFKTPCRRINIHDNHISFDSLLYLDESSDVSHFPIHWMEYRFLYQMAYSLYCWLRSMSENEMIFSDKIM